MANKSEIMMPNAFGKKNQSISLLKTFRREEEECLELKAAIMSCRQMLAAKEEKRVKMCQEYNRYCFEIKELTSSTSHLQETFVKNSITLDSMKKAREVAPMHKKLKEDSYKNALKDFNHDKKVKSCELEDAKATWEDYLKIYKKYELADVYHSELDKFERINAMAIKLEADRIAIDKNLKVSKEQMKELSSKDPVMENLHIYCIELAKYYLYVSRNEDVDKKRRLLQEYNKKMGKDQMLLSMLKGTCSQPSIPDFLAKERDAQKSSLPQPMTLMSSQNNTMDKPGNQFDISHSTPQRHTEHKGAMEDEKFLKPSPVKPLPKKAAADVRRTYSLSQIAQKPDENKPLSRSLSNTNIVTIPGSIKSPVEDPTPCSKVSPNKYCKPQQNEHKSVEAWVRTGSQPNSQEHMEDEENDIPINPVKKPLQFTTELRPVEMPLLRVIQEKKIQEKSGISSMMGDSVQMSPAAQTNIKSPEYKPRFSFGQSLESDAEPTGQFGFSSMDSGFNVEEYSATSNFMDGFSQQSIFGNNETTRSKSLSEFKEPFAPDDSREFKSFGSSDFNLEKPSFMFDSGNADADKGNTSFECNDDKGGSFMNYSFSLSDGDKAIKFD